MNFGNKFITGWCLSDEHLYCGKSDFW